MISFFFLIIYLGPIVLMMIVSTNTQWHLQRRRSQKCVSSVECNKLNTTKRPVLIHFLNELSTVSGCVWDVLVELYHTTEASLGLMGFRLFNRMQDFLLQSTWEFTKNNPVKHFVSLGHQDLAHTHMHAHMHTHMHTSPWRCSCRFLPADTVFLCAGPHRPD